MINVQSNPILQNYSWRSNIAKVRCLDDDLMSRAGLCWIKASRSHVKISISLAENYLSWAESIWQPVVFVHIGMALTLCMALPSTLQADPDLDSLVMCMALPSTVQGGQLDPNTKNLMFIF